MRDDVWAHIGAASGILFVLLLVAGLIFGPGVLDQPGFNADATEVADYVADNRNELQALTTLEVAAGFAFVLFLGSIALALRSAEGAPGRLSAAAFAGGVVFLAVAATGVVAQAVSVYRVEDEELIRAFIDMRDSAFVVAGFGVAALLWFSGVLTLRFGALPFPLAPLSMVGGLYILVVSVFGAFTEDGGFSRTDGVLQFIAFLVVLAWVAATSAVLTAKPVWTRASRR